MKGPQVFILRGLSGSGKSTLAKQIKHNLSEPVAIVSADHFFTTADGQYHFDGSKLKQAHEQCWDQYVLLLQAGSSVIVDNTNSQHWHYSKYFDQAVASNIPVTILEIPCPDMATLHVFHLRSKHNVPLFIMKNMYRLWELDSRSTLVSNTFSFMIQMTA